MEGLLVGGASGVVISFVSCGMRNLLCVRFGL